MVSKEKFMSDLEKVYSFSEEQRDSLSKLYDQDSTNSKEIRGLRECCALWDVQDEEGFDQVLARRLVMLKDDHLINFMKKENVSSDLQKEVLSNAYYFASELHCEKFRDMIDFIDSNELLTPFYREVIALSYGVGLEFTKLHVSWDKAISNVNDKLLDKFGDSEKVVQFLQDNLLIDKFENGDIGDRSYSILIEDLDSSIGYKTVSYKEFFSKEVSDICLKLSEMILKLESLEDEVFGQKDFWIVYLGRLRDALNETDVDRLILKWQDVDFAWMNVKSPIQVCHMMEYYKDSFRNCVEIEWDLRIINPKRNNADKVVSDVSNLFEKLKKEAGKKGNNEIFESTRDNLGKVQLYVGKPILYFGKFFAGLISAQVIPNDEFISKIEGKKIFAFADMILQTEKSMPKMKLSDKVLSKEFRKRHNDLVFGDSDVWHKVYSISTIGHEYGHILWKGEKTEVLLNKSGNMKNIEEWKATIGGFVSFYETYKNDGDVVLFEAVMIELIGRAIKLIAWMKTEEVRPYYCEGLITLDGLFNVGILDFNGSDLEINLDLDKFKVFANWAVKTYTKLAYDTYLMQADANGFLYDYVVREGEVFLPKNSKVYEFVNWYWDLFEKIGTERV